MNAFDRFRKFADVLLEEMRSYFFLILVLFAAITYYSDIYLHLDGSIFVLQTFFEDSLPNYFDISRIVAIIGTHLPALLYVFCDGLNFAIFTNLFNLGHIVHIFFPFLLLAYLKYRNPDCRNFVRDSFSIYVCSLLFYRSFCNLFLVSELHFAHTLTWLIFFSFRYNMLFSVASNFCRNVIWTFSILAIFTYPITLFTFLILFIVQLVSTDNIPLKHSQDWRAFFISAFFVNLIFLFCYLSLFITQVLITREILRFYRNDYAKLMIGTFLLFVLLRPFFRYQNYIVLVLSIFIYFKMQHRYPFYHLGVRTYGAIAILFFQTYYLFFYQNSSNLIPFKQKVRPYCIYILAVFICQGYQMIEHQKRILSIVKTHKGNISYDEVAQLLPMIPLFYHNEWNLRNFSLAVQLKDENKIYSIIDPHPMRTGGTIHNWGTEKLHAHLRNKNIEFDPGITVNRFQMAADP